MSEGDLTIHVCTACRRARADLPEGYDQPGLALAERLAEQLKAKGSTIPVLPVECLCVCKRPCTIALSADGNWTYLIGDLDTDTHLDEIVGAAEAYAASANGIATGVVYALVAAGLSLLFKVLDTVNLPDDPRALARIICQSVAAHQTPAKTRMTARAKQLSPSRTAPAYGMLGSMCA